MDDRSPKLPRSGAKPAGGLGVRGTNNPLAQFVRERLANDPVWSVVAQNGKWICPYCLNGVIKRVGRSHEESLALHLEGCRSYASGRGQAQAQNLVEERMHFENMTFQAESQPSWRVYDPDGVWYCPACLDRVTAVRLQGGQLSNFVFQAMAGHLRNCASYRQGVMHPPEDLMAARDRYARAPGLGATVMNALQQPVWRYTNTSGHWVCPLCLAHVPEVVVVQPTDWQHRVEAMAKHLLLHCGNFDPEHIEPQPEELVQQAAGGRLRGGMPQARNDRTPTGGATRVGLPILPQRQGGRMPTVARSGNSGGHAISPSAGNAPIAGGAQQVSTGTPHSASPLQVTPKPAAGPIRTPVALPSQPLTPQPPPATTPKPAQAHDVPVHLPLPMPWETQSAAPPTPPPAEAPVAQAPVSAPVMPSLPPPFPVQPPVFAPTSAHRPPQSPFPQQPASPFPLMPPTGQQAPPTPMSQAPSYTPPDGNARGPIRRSLRSAGPPPIQPPPIMQPPPIQQQPPIQQSVTSGFRTPPPNGMAPPIAAALRTPPPVPPMRTPPPLPNPQIISARAKPDAPLFEDFQGDPLLGTPLGNIESDRVRPQGIRPEFTEEYSELPESDLPESDLPPADDAEDAAARADAIAVQNDFTTTGLDWMEEADRASNVPEVEQHGRTDVINARAFQGSMLAHTPTLPGYTFATRYEACSDITGDFFEFITMADGRVGFALADVSGHGVQAGLIMSMAKKTLEIYASIGQGPADTLAKVNDALARDLGGKMFISMVYGILSPDTRSITWARAGGTPVFRLSAQTGELSEVKPKGMVLGMKSGQIFRQSLEEQVTRLDAGDKFLLYTDGITETMNTNQEEFGSDRLGEVLRSFSNERPDRMLDMVMERLRMFRGPLAVSDDLTMLALAVE